jgi:hypothetical protein
MFWGSVCKRHDYSLRPLLPGDAGIVFFPASLIGTASFMHCIKRGDYTDMHYVD